MTGAGAAFHWSFVFTGLLVHAAPRLSAADQAVVSELPSSFTNAQAGLLAGASAGLALFSGSFAGACLTGATAYPRWCAAANPLLLFALLAALGLWLPAVGLVTVPAG